MKFPVPRTYAIAIAVIAALLVASGTYAWYLGDRILPNTKIGAVSVGGMTRDEAVERLQEALDHFDEDGIQLAIDGEQEVIQPVAVSFDLDFGKAIDEAFAFGHEGFWLSRMWQRATSLVHGHRVIAPIMLDEAALRLRISDVAEAINVGRSDVRFQVTGTTVTLLTDTKPGKAIDQGEAFEKIKNTLSTLKNTSIVLQLHDDIPRADPEKAKEAVSDAKTMIARSLLLQYEDLQFYISREKLGSWIVSNYEDDQLKAGLSNADISAYVTTIAKALNIAPKPPQITTEGGRIVGFVPSEVGRSVQEDDLIKQIINEVTARKEGEGANVITIPVKSSAMALRGLDDTSGIQELVGKATTPFTGSPRNRISNIKNGVKFLSGVVIQPGEEFSTLGTLGTIDNTTGYLPELVIKGDRTQPEFGGGLCQVSTTLFRAALDAGLQITERRNHSYRVSYYEKDGNGHYIGPGLDATIYEPDVDLKFINNMEHPILIIGYVIGDRVTFEFYGTEDGRESLIVGPKLLSETEPGDPVYIDEPTLPVGVTKQVETPHSGGSAVATYIVTYADGHKDVTEFKSWYRRWPAQYLVGTGTRE